jgi:DNA invertase Pin-like site-specific DNA recombinase
LGYVRVSTLDQNEQGQLERKTLERVFTDRASGKEIRRPKLEELIPFARAGDTVMVHSMDRLARNLVYLRSVVQTLTAKGARVEFVKEGLVFTGEKSPMANLMLSVMGAFAEFERTLMKERQRGGIALVKTRGVYKGRKYALDPERLSSWLPRPPLGSPRPKSPWNTL